ncbi:hypothetical protein I5Q34_07780 [Streptomyces sp. AV19]|uniref:hypothetical protein n=1 Tax=Streptomyces sp. AV19 TaxID=2793068 RepID=UPI0018FE655B|nr:hypothetical protein [Streptomyces sp. AV19]MBH1934197.1 hypothetical protein [Streptomyces sp. AV19]MDG4533883.1 hypothetical protein [Streptomyces sp. AV19]
MHQVVFTSYGRHELRLLGVRPGTHAHAARDFRLTMTLEGEFTPAFAAGDNRSILPTRSMTNTASAFVHDHLDASVEHLALALAERLLEACPAASIAHVAVTEHPWSPLPGSRHTFATSPSDQWLADATAPRGRPATVVSGISGLHRAVTTGSSFTGFLVDDYTHAHEVNAEDRVLRMSGDMRWEYSRPPADYDQYRTRARRAFMDSTADQLSASSQHSACLSAAAVLDACPLISQISVHFRHHAHAPLDLRPFGRDDRSGVWLGTDSSYGAGAVTVRRDTGG